MNILFSTQTEGIKLFYSLLEQLRQDIDITTAGFYVAHRMSFERFAAEHPDIQSNYSIVKEWEIVRAAKTVVPDMEKINRCEREIGDPTLWNALVCDRRMYMGRRCKQRQDYTPLFSHEQMLCILHVTIEKIEQLFREVKPDVVLSLDPVTFGDYFLYLFARARGIPTLFFRATKIKNYIELSDCVYGASNHVRSLVKNRASMSEEDEYEQKAREYILEAKNNHIRYEGMILNPTCELNTQHASQNILSSIGAVMKDCYSHSVRYRSDHHQPGIITPLVYSKLITPLKRVDFNMRFRRAFVSPESLSTVRYAFYPLQSEPEIATLIWARPFMNQIETIRTIALSLPVGMKLVVKEHPRALGYRTHNYYHKLLEIPNVLLAHPHSEVRPFIEQSELVISLSTFVAFEAVLYHKPSIMLGGPRPFCQMLPESMIRFMPNLYELGAAIIDIQKQYNYDQKSLENYIAATMQGSVAVDYYTILLHKQKRFSESKHESYKDEIKKLVSYTVQRIHDVINTNTSEESV